MRTSRQHPRGKWYSLLVGAPLLFAAVAIPCVPDGGSSTVTLPRPPLPPAPAGAPGSSSWGGGAPQAYEHDDASPNDPMGPATPGSGGSDASVEVSNSGGDLSGPNGDVVNGGWEGDCIEVTICWTYNTWVRRQKFVFTETGYAIIYYWAYVTKEVCNGGNDVEVCPC